MSRRCPTFTPHREIIVKTAPESYLLVIVRADSSIHCESSPCRVSIPVTLEKIMLYWECRRRLRQLQQFRILAADYFDNVTHASWMAGRTPILNDKAQRARHQINLMMNEVAFSLDLI